MRVPTVAAVVVAGCTSSGALDLELSLPTAAELRPAGMTTVSVIASSRELAPIENTSVLTGTSFHAGELPLGKDIQIDVLLHDAANRLVGLGEAGQLVELANDKATKLAIPVRRPFVYATDGKDAYTFDPSRDPRDAKFQGKLTGLTTPQVAVSVGGDKLVIAGGAQLQVVDTATHQVTGSAIALPAGATVHDAAPVPGGKRVVVAHAKGISVVDLGSGDVQTAMVPGGVDRVTVGTAGGAAVAYGLVARVAPPDMPFAACTGASSLVVVPVDAVPASVTATGFGAAVAGIAASADGAGLFAALPCAGQVARVDGPPDTATPTLTKLADLPNAAVIAAQGGRVWAAGTAPAAPVCASSSGTKTSCTASTMVSCSATGTHLDYVTEGAHVVVQSIPIAGGDPVTLAMPERRETMIDTDDPARQHAQVLRPLSAVPADLVALPGGQYVSLVVHSRYYISSLSDSSSSTVILPCLDATTGDWLLDDLASSSVAQRVRTQCKLFVGPATDFPNWKCEDPPVGEASAFAADYLATSVGALFGAR